MTLIIKTAHYNHVQKYILLESASICLHYDVKIIVVCLTITNYHILFTCKQKQDGHREIHKCFLYSVIWTITSNYPIIITLARSMRYMPYTTHHVYSLLKIEKCSLSNIFVIDLFHYRPWHSTITIEELPWSWQITCQQS